MMLHRLLFSYIRPQRYFFRFDIPPEQLVLVAARQKHTNENRLNQRNKTRNKKTQKLELLRATCEWPETYFLFKTIKMLTKRKKLHKIKGKNHFVVPSFSLRFFVFLLCVNPFPGKNFYVFYVCSPCETTTDGAIFFFFLFCDSLLFIHFINKIYNKKEQTSQSS